MSAGIFLSAGQGVATAGGEHYVPSHDPMVLDADYAWFEPVYDADLIDMKPKKRAHTGWFGSYDRMHLFTTRPDNSPGDWLLDRGRGHRFDVGYMLGNDHGFSATYMDYKVKAYDGYARERLNRLVPIDDDGSLIGPELGPPFGQPSIPTDGNVLGTNSRFVDMLDSENVADFRSFEFNKTWRMEPYHYGGILEPLVGVRYMRFEDLYQRMTYTSGQFFVPATDPLEPEFYAGEEVLTERSIATNDLVGGQIGFRYFKFIDRFRYSAELRAFTLASFQSNKLQTFQETTLYESSPVEAGDDVAHYLLDQTNPIYGKNREFSWGYEIRSELSYTLTRMIEVRGGFQLIDIAQGIWRGRLIDPTSNRNQRALMAGFTFGVALNR